MNKTPPARDVEHAKENLLRRRAMAEKRRRRYTKAD
jgi:hypothetical protein